MNISNCRFVLFNLKVFGKIVTNLKCYRKTISSSVWFDSELSRTQKLVNTIGCWYISRHSSKLLPRQMIISVLHTRKSAFKPKKIPLKTTCCKIYLSNKIFIDPAPLLFKHTSYAGKSFFLEVCVGLLYST